MSSHDDDNLDFDFFDDDATREAPGAGRARRAAAPVGRRRWRRAAAAPVSRTARRDADPPPDRVRRVRHPDRRPARPLGAGLLGRQEAQRLLGRDDAARHDRLQLGQDRLEPRRAPDDAGAQAGRARDVPAGADRPAAAGRRQRVERRRAGAAAPVDRPCGRGARPSRQRDAGAARHVQGDEGRRLEERDDRRREAGRAGAPARCQRRRLAGRCSAFRPRRRCRTRASAT